MVKVVAIAMAMPRLISCRLVRSGFIGGVVSETEVFSVNCDNQFKEKDGEVVKENLVFFSRRWRQGFNRRRRRE